MPKGNLICVGALAGSYGVRGEVRLKSFCADPSAIQDYSPLTTEDGSKQFDLAIIGTVKGGFSGRIVGINSKEAADALKGTRLYTTRDQLPQTGDDEYYYSDLIGLMVKDTGGAEIGKIKAVLDHGAQDVLEVHLPGTRETGLIPFTQAMVPTVDLASGSVIVDLPPGLLPDG